MHTLSFLWNSIQLNVGKDFSLLCEKCMPTVLTSYSIPAGTCRLRYHNSQREENEMVGCKVRWWFTNKMTNKQSNKHYKKHPCRNLLFAFSQQPERGHWDGGTQGEMMIHKPGEPIWCQIGGLCPIGQIQWDLIWLNLGNMLIYMVSPYDVILGTCVPLSKLK